MTDAHSADVVASAEREVRGVRAHLPALQARIGRAAWDPALEGAALGAIVSVSTNAAGAGAEFIYFSSDCARYGGEQEFENPQEGAMRRILVTGANKGIGLAIATAILEEHADTFVLIGSRDAERGRIAVEGLRAGRPDWNERVQLLPLDVGSDDSVARAAQAVQQPLYAVVNNAGVGSDDLRATLNVNLFGVRRVSEAFLSRLDPNAGRIVNVTSAAGPNFVGACSPERQRFFLDPAITWPQLQALVDECLAIDGKSGFAAKGLGDGSAYGLSKACANSYTMLLARENPHLRINACTPGFIETDMTRHFARSQNKTPAEIGMKPPSAGARSTMYLLFADLEGNGRYYGSDAKRSPLDRYRAPGDPPYSDARIRTRWS